jgi:hypothetical protein
VVCGTSHNSREERRKKEGRENMEEGKIVEGIEKRKEGRK